MAKKKTKKVVQKKSAKKKVVQKKAGKKAVKKSWSNFNDWWDKVAQKKTEKIERNWIKENEPNDPEEEEGGDHWCVNEMMHSGDALEMVYEKAQEVWETAIKGKPWEMNQCDSLYCELDDIIVEAYEAGRLSKK